MDPLSDAKVIDSWNKNAAPWTAAVRENQIASRALVTNDAIVAAVRDRKPRTMLDVGCGEGWLVRALAAQGVQGTGVDVVEGLIDRARSAGGGEFHVASYEDIVAGALDLRVDVVVANFALIGGDAVDALLRAIPGLLNPGGALIIQTLHPCFGARDAAYADGWRAGSWTGFSEEFTDPAPWYFRTLGGWVSAIAASGLRLVEVREPRHPQTGDPASIIFIAEATG